MRLARLVTRIARCAALTGLLVASGSFLPAAAIGQPRDFGSGSGERSGFVGIGQDRSIYLECSGAGSPTVILISGAGVAADNWSYTGDPNDQTNAAKRTAYAVYPSVATFTSVCVYDRPGTEQMGGTASRSTPVPQPTTTQSAAADLHALLAAAQVAAPYVLVGHSWGGLIAQTYARTFPQDVAGLVLVDPSTQYLPTVLPPEVWTQWTESLRQHGWEHPGFETTDHASSILQLDASPALPTMPVSVLSADKPFDYLGIGDATTYWPQWLDAATMLSTSLAAKHITKTNSGHFIENVNPALVIGEICAVVAPKQACSTD